MPSVTVVNATRIAGMAGDIGTRAGEREPWCKTSDTCSTTQKASLLPWTFSVEG